MLLEIDPGEELRRDHEAPRAGNPGPAPRLHHAGEIDVRITKCAMDDDHRMRDVRSRLVQRRAGVQRKFGATEVQPLVGDDGDRVLLRDLADLG